MKKKFETTGLDNPEVFQAIRLNGVEDITQSIYPDAAVELTEEAKLYLSVQLAKATARADFARRLEEDGWRKTTGLEVNLSKCVATPSAGQHSRADVNAFTG